METSASCEDKSVFVLAYSVGPGVILRETEQKTSEQEQRSGGEYAPT